MADSTIVVDGLAELNRAFTLAGKDTKKELNKALRRAVEPIRSASELNAVSAIPRIGMPWSRMRVGVTTNAVYVAPRRRGTTFPPDKRRNLPGLLMDRAMLPALDANIANVERQVGEALDTICAEWERV